MLIKNPFPECVGGGIILHGCKNHHRKTQAFRKSDPSLLNLFAGIYYSGYFTIDFFSHVLFFENPNALSKIEQFYKTKNIGICFLIYLS